MLRSKLQYKEVVLGEECDIKRLSLYDMVFFLILPTQIGNKFFIQAIEEILRIRRSGKTIFLAIDDSYRLDEHEIIKVTLELKTSIRHLISNPTVYTVSSYYAAIGLQYELGNLTLEELMHNRELMIPTKSEGILTGKQIDSEHAAQLIPLSGMNQLFLQNLEADHDLRDSPIDVTKKNWYVLGPPNSGKSTFTPLVQTRIRDPEHYNFIELSFDSMNLVQYCDGIIILLDLDIVNNTAYLEDVCSKYASLDKVVIVNKIDEFMFHHMSRQDLEEKLTQAIKLVTSGNIYFISSLYYQCYVDYLSGQIQLIDIMKNPDIVLEDSLNFPISKTKNKSTLLDLLSDRSGFDKLIQIWE